MNNLLERLHASFFFYLLTTPRTFLKIGLYLPAPIMISVSLLFGGLQAWVQAGWRLVVRDVDEKKRKEKGQSSLNASSGQVTEWETRPRPVIEAVAVIIATHALGAVVFVAVDLTQQFRWSSGWTRIIMAIVCDLRFIHCVAN
jgi:glycosylphosphatidylinositol transamidase